MSPSHNAEAMQVRYSFNINTTSIAIILNMACKYLLYGGACKEALVEGWEVLGGSGG